VWYLLLTAAFLWPLIAGVATVVPHGPRDPGFQATVLANISDRLAHLDLRNLFNGSFYYPAHLTLAMADTQIGLQPLALPLRVLGLDALTVLNLLTIVSFPVTAAVGHILGAYLTRTRAGGLVVGTALAFAPYRMEHVIHLQLLQSWTIAMAFLGAEMTLRERSRRGWAVWGIALVATAATSLNYLPILVVTQGTYLAARWLASGRRRTLGRRLAGMLIPAFAAAVPIAVLAVPYVALRLEGYSRSAASTFEFSARLTDYLVPSADTWLLGPLFRAFKPLTGIDERELLPGFVITALAAVGLAIALQPSNRRRLRRLAPWLVMTGVAVLFSLGPYLWPSTAAAPDGLAGLVRLPYAYVSRLLLLDSVRAPARFGVVVLLGIAVLAAFSLVRLLRLVRGRHLRRAAVGLVALAMAVEYAVVIPVVTVPWGATLPQAYRYLEAHPGGPVVEMPPASSDPFAGASYYMLASTVDGHPRLNGWSGFQPHMSKPIVVSPITPANLDAWLAACRRLGAVYVLVHGADLPPATIEAVHARRDAGTIVAVGTFGADELYQFGAAS
jgi:hypothetical protein